MSITVLALDLERTLIDDARSGRPRPGLRDFLNFCAANFQRIAVYTTVDNDDARDVLSQLDEHGLLPPGLFRRLEYVDWQGEYKDLDFIPNAVPQEVLLIDDDAGWIRLDQRSQWIPIIGWDGGPDAELSRVKSVIEQRLITERDRLL